MTGGLLRLAAGAAISAALTLLACGPPTTAGPPGPEPATRVRLPDPLAVYDTLGFIVGDPSVPAVGRFVFLPGPADSSYAGFTFSIPNSALRFRRNDPGFLARYRVDLTVGDSSAPLARLSRTEQVRVYSFRETSRRDESVVFQGFLTLPPGRYPARVEVRDLASTAGFTARAPLAVPAFGPGSLTAPIVVYEARPRSTRDEPPALILRPRATVEMGGAPVRVYLESLPAAPAAAAPAVLEVRQEGEVIQVDSLEFGPSSDPLRAATVSLDPESLPPGVLDLQTRSASSTTADSAVLVVALVGDWLAIDYETAIGYLRYAGTPQQLDSLHAAPPGERAERLHTFWKMRDPDPDTPANEFFERYFRRIRNANDQFSTATTAGWLTDRGAVYVALGPPDEITRQLDARQGTGLPQVWLYDESLGFDVRLVFVDPTGAGDYSLTVESRGVFAEAVQTLYSRAPVSSPSLIHPPH